MCLSKNQKYLSKLSQARDVQKQMCTAPKFRNMPNNTNSCLPICDQPRRWNVTTKNKQTNKTVTYAKISTKMVHPRDIAGNTEEEEEEGEEEEGEEVSVIKTTLNTLTMEGAIVDSKEAGTKLWVSDDKLEGAFHVKALDASILPVSHTHQVQVLGHRHTVRDAEPAWLGLHTSCTIHFIFNKLVQVKTLCMYQRSITVFLFVSLLICFAFQFVLILNCTAWV